jgi:tRNA A-37 threonylcarbamoyl transferase component Bud32
VAHSWRPQRGLFVGLVLAAPLAWFTYLLGVPRANQAFEVERFYELVSWINFAVVPILGVLALTTQLTTGDRRAAALAVAALAFSAVFPLHRLFTAEQNTGPFLFYGTLARFAFAASFLLMTGRKRPAAPVERRWNVLWIVLLAGVLAVTRYLLKGTLDVWAVSRDNLPGQVHRGLELAAALLAAAAAWRLVRTELPHGLRTAAVLPLAFALFAEQSLFFLASNGTDLFWWSGHVLWAMANLLLIGVALETAADAATPAGSGGAVAAGQSLAGYEILEPLGEGGMGRVFKARHGRLNRVVALKVIRTEQLVNPHAVRRFQREARAAARLAHPNIMQIYDAAEAEGTHFLVMEYVAGQDLAELVRTRGPLPVSLAGHYARQVSLALQHAHERGLVHRDIKPANLLLGADGTQVKVLDMGVARFLQPDETDLPAGELTQTGAVMGTPAYLAPEQARDARRVDIRGDIYSLGCTLYQLLSGQVPFRGESLAEVVLGHQLMEPPPLDDVRPDVPPEMQAVLRKMMAKRPEDRYQTPAEVAEALAAFAELDRAALAKWLAGANGGTGVPTEKETATPPIRG